MNSEKHIVFFTPTLNRTGSELVLFNLLPFLPSSYKATVVTKFKGPLYQQLPTFVKKEFLFNDQFPKRLSDKVYRKLFGKYVLAKKLKKHQHAVWYINTILLPDILDIAVKLNVKVILHVHELAHMYKLLTEQQIQTLVSYPKLFIANSETSKKVLIQYHAVNEIQICYPALDYSKFNFDQGLYENVRKSLSITDEFVWVMSGSFDANKNPKLFVDIAAIVKAQKVKVKFMWVGLNSTNKTEINACKAYALEKNVSDVVLWLECTDNYFEYFNCADGFVLTSKLESFSLVTLEALHLGLPIVANNCFGVNEILGKDYGIIIDNENSQDMAEEIINFTKNGKIRMIKKGKGVAMKFDLGLIKDKWLNYLNTFFS